MLQNSCTRMSDRIATAVRVPRLPETWLVTLWVIAAGTCIPQCRVSRPRLSRGWAVQPGILYCKCTCCLTPLSAPPGPG